jgi:hypothetical protein
MFATIGEYIAHLVLVAEDHDREVGIGSKEPALSAARLSMARILARANSRSSRAWPMEISALAAAPEQSVHRCDQTATQ